MARPIAVLDLGIVLRAHVDILDEEGDRRAGGQELAVLLLGEDAGKNAHRIRLAPLGGEARLAGAPLLHPVLNLGFRDRDARRTAVDDAADGGPMAFAPGGDPKEMTEGVVRHASPALGGKLLGRGCGNRQTPRPSHAPGLASGTRPAARQSDAGFVQIHVSRPSSNTSTRSCGKGVEMAATGSRPRIMRRRTRPTPPWETAKVGRSMPASQSATRSERMR